MLPVQVEYWKNQESIRHNRETESQGRRGLAINEYEAESGRMTASANLQNAATNIRNADTNLRNAITNERNAATNEQNAISQRMQAIASQSQAESAASQAQATWANVGVNQMNAATNQFKAQTERNLATSEIAMNTWNTTGEGGSSKVVANYAASSQASASLASAKAAQKQANITERLYDVQRAKIESETKRNEAEAATSWVRAITQGFGSTVQASSALANMSK